MSLVGLEVQYHGSIEAAHGLYKVTRDALDPEGRGYSLFKVGGDPEDPKHVLYYVHRDSFTLV